MIAFLFFSMMFLFSLGGMLIKYIGRKILEEECEEMAKKYKFYNSTPDLRTLMKEIEKVENGTYSN